MRDNEIFAQCPNCKCSLRVVIGRKSTVRRATCTQCGRAYSYSAWKLRRLRAGEPVGLRTFYQVDLFPEVL